MLKLFKKKKGTPAPVEPEIYAEPEPQPPDKEKLGWVSPQYTVSRYLPLDPAVLEENRCAAYFPDAAEMDFYRVLRSQVIKVASPAGGNAIMVTSALPGEGKTLTAINLSFIIAREFNRTVLLVDCDFKKQAVHEMLGIAPNRGLADYLLDGRPLSDIIVWPGVEKVTLISGGRTVQESSELLGSPRMQELLAELKARYPDRYLIFDLSPVLSGADALAFAPLIDYIIFVVEAGRTPREDIRRALALLPREKILGLVLNRQESRKSPGYDGKYPYKKRTHASE
ncbi:MAG: AAA family ATPase [Syntrophaceae bacterium]|nr:AAA family ATPase [Syntrophaceae bacterium]